MARLNVFYNISGLVGSEHNSIRQTDPVLLRPFKTLIEDVCLIIRSVIGACLMFVVGLGPTWAEDDRFFDNDDSTRFDYDTDFPPEQSNRFDDVPAINISTFKYLDFRDLPDYNVRLSDVQAIVETFRTEKNGRFTVASLNELVGLLTDYYREKGLILARVIVPEQRIDESTLTLQLVIGTLQSVTPVGPSHYGEAILKRPFQSQVDQPVHRSSLENALLVLSDYPGVSIESSLAPGTEPGTTQLALRVVDETPFTTRISADNYGDAESGRYRLTLSGQYNNPTDKADVLSGMVRTSLFPANTFSTRLDYRLPLDSLDLVGPPVAWDNTDWTAGFRLNRFNVGGDLEALDINGQSSEYRTAFERTLHHTRDERLVAHTALSKKFSESDQSDAALWRDNLTVLNLGGHWQRTDDFLGGGFSRLSASVDQGLGAFLGGMEADGDADSSRQGASGDKAGGAFTKWRLSGERVQAFAGQFFSIRTEIQYSPDLLTSLEQYSIGGPGTVRGFPVADLTADSILQFNLEYYGLSYAPRLTLPISQLKLASYWDMAWGTYNDALPNEEAYPSAMGVGVYTRFVLAEDFTALLDVGMPIGSQQPTDGSGFQITFNISRTF